jgi:pilus assembly protein CpaD
MSSRSLRVFALMTAAAMTLSACASTPASGPVAKTEPLSTEQYPLQVAGHPDEIRLAPHEGPLSPAQRSAIVALASRWMDDGGGALTVQAPTKGADPRAASATSLQAMALLQAMGASSERLHLVGYEPPAAGPAPVIIGFVAYEAQVPKCGTAWENLAANGKNKPMGNFGCAVSANMAAQIANPGDIQQARATDPADAGRRAVVLDKYRLGDVTSAAKDAGANGAVSKPSSGGGSGG